LILFLALTVGSWIMPRIPRRVAYKLTQVVGAIGYVVARKPRDNIQNNLAVVMGNPATSRLVRAAALRAFQNNAKNWCDTLRLEETTKDEIEELVHVEGWERLDEALALGQGLILLGIHLGNIDIVGQIVAARGLKLTVPVENMQPEQLFRRVQKLRQSFGIKTVPLSAGPRPLLAALNRNEIVGVLCDRNIADTGVEVHFFDKPAIVSKGPAWLAGLSHAPVLMGVGIRTADNRFAGIVTPPINILRTGNRQSDHRENAQTIMSTAEALIRQYPDQWLMFANVWKEGPNPVGQELQHAARTASG
jgi:lauroyl/myristoyl acyltransferase